MTVELTLTPDAKIALAMKAAEIREDIFPYVFHKILRDGYGHRPDDVGLAINRLREEMPMAFEQQEVKPTLLDMLRERKRGAV